MTIRKKIFEHRNLYNKNESAVRTQLIEPVLKALGWKTEDPTHLAINSHLDDGDIPDYTLLINSEIITFLEAKKMSVNIHESITQLVKYCLKEGKEYGILTNGNDWMLIKTFEKNTKLIDRIIWEITIDTDEISRIQAYLSLISRDQINSLPMIIESEKEIEKFWMDNMKNEAIIEHIALGFADNFVKEYPKNLYSSTSSSAAIFFIKKIQSLLTPNDDEHIEIEKYKTVNNNKKEGLKISNNQKRRKSKSPSAAEWSNKIPELKKYGNLNSWTNICTKLGIEVGSNSARRALLDWVRVNKPNWPSVPTV